MKNSKYYMICLVLTLICCFTLTMPVLAMADPDTEAEEVQIVLEPGEPFSEETDIVTRDLLYDKATNKQFITIQDRDGNIFYLVIDYDAPVDEKEEQYQTYFLNPVDTEDLAALAENTKPAACSCSTRCQAGAVNMDCELCAKDMTECIGKEPKPVQPEPTPATEEPEPEKEKSSGLNPTVLFLFLALVGGGGAFAYFKLVKNKPKTAGNDNLDDYDYGEDEEESEDNEPWEKENEDAETKRTEESEDTVS